MKKKYPLMIITEVHPHDAFFGSEEDVLGQVIQPKEIKTDADGWSTVTGTYQDIKWSSGILLECVFYKVKLSEKVNEQA